MTRRVIPAEVREGMQARLEDLETRQIPELEGESAAGDVDAFALLKTLRQERDHLVDTLREDAEEGTWDPRRIEVGDAVVVREVGRDEDEEFLLVPAEVGSRVGDGWVSDKSPLGSVLVGAARGEVVEVAAPGGMRRYLIVDFRAA
ncbi:MAG TPA: GreA/GreB family elongation factor [Acidimicrobiia bacterium]|nr:GreA/GreB family elongation factor [Acidimicrobiia bacterium]